MLPAAFTALEDELGDVLEKALRQAELEAGEAARRAAVAESRLQDAIDYRSDLRCDELQRLARVLSLNEVGLCALASGRYPLPETGGLPFEVRPLRMRHGIGVVNAYTVAAPGAARALLFDTGSGIAALEAGWPPEVRGLDAVFLTHVETEHAGALCEVVQRFGGPDAFVPRGVPAPCGKPLDEGAVRAYGPLQVTVFSTPGHCAAHSSYWVRDPQVAGAPGLFVAGDLIFAGSAGGGYFCHRQLRRNLRRVLDTLPPATVIAPGHGPMTTVENELRFNPFLA